MLPALCAPAHSSYRRSLTLTISRGCKAHPLSPLLRIRNLTTTRTYATVDTSRKPTNDKIPHTHVRIIDPETSKLSAAPTRLTDLLASLDLKKDLVELATSSPEPIVRIVDRKEAFAKYKELKKALKKGNKSGEAAKEIQLTWGVAKGDLEHKLAKARTQMEKGHRVAVVLAPKKGQTLPTPKEMQARAQEVEEALRDTGKEWREREVTKTMTIMSFQKHSL
ncbi:hypothetical protein BDN67DRAFT_532106 [Paxillus ammoniavirescens]|nr:hypothetical protein BDN67DRAFT_532106 [Paxillus ammoniavirescens]